MMVTLSPASVEDAATILDLQKLAYQSEAKIYNDWSLPALTQSLEELQAEFADNKFINAVSGGEIVGSIRAKGTDETCDIGRLIVHPKMQGQGIGSKLLKAMEEAFSGVKRYELFTGNKSVANIRLYERKGYKVIREEPLSDNVSIVFMEKKAAS